MSGCQGRLCDNDTSLEIAELTGKQCKNVMKAIRNMEPAWEKIAGLKFQLSTYKDSTRRTLPCYQLTKTDFTPCGHVVICHLSKSKTDSQNPPLYNKYFIFIYSEQWPRFRNWKWPNDLDQMTTNAFWLCNVQTMMSLEIAELTGKQLKHVMEAIRRRNMHGRKSTGRIFGWLNIGTRKGVRG